MKVHHRKYQTRCYTVPSYEPAPLKTTGVPTNHKTHDNELAAALSSESSMASAQASAQAAEEARGHAQAAASSLVLAKKSIVDEVVKQLQKDPSEPLDLVTLSYVNNMNDNLRFNLIKDRKEAFQKYDVEKTHIQYLFLQGAVTTGGTGSEHTIYLGEPFYWPSKATIVSVSVQHSAGGTSKLRMLSFVEQHTKTELAESDTVPYMMNNLSFRIPARTKVYFSVVTTKAIPTVAVVLGILWHPIE